MRVQTPNTSLYPEIDFASKVVADDSLETTPFAPLTSVSQLLSPLNNATSVEVRRRLNLRRFFTRFSANPFDGQRKVVLTLEDNGLLLSGKTKVQTENSETMNGVTVF
jgi:hypothetical protein